MSIARSERDGRVYDTFEMGSHEKDDCAALLSGRIGERMAPG
jgi:hypothetical protein